MTGIPEQLWTIGADITFKATLLFAAAMLLDRALRTRHLLACSSTWNACLIGLVLLPLATIAFPRLRIECLPPQPASDESRSIPLETPSASTIAQHHLDIAETTLPTHTQALVGSIAHTQPQLQGEDASVPADSAAARPVAISPQPVTTQPVPWQSWLLDTYFLGVALFAVRLASSLQTVRRLRQSSPPLTVPAWTDALRRWCRRLGDEHAIHLSHSHRIDTPIVVGWRNPTILIPTTMVSTTTPHQRDAILVHELAHIQRADCRWQLLLAVLQIFYWFHPLTWITARSMAGVRERACDDYCIHWLGGSRDYGTALLDLAARMIRSHELALGLAAVRPSTIEQRLAHIDQSSGIANCRSSRPMRTLLLAVAASATITIGSLELARAEPPRPPIQSSDEAKAGEDLPKEPADVGHANTPKADNNRPTSQAESAKLKKSAQDMLSEARNLLATPPKSDDGDESSKLGERIYVISFKAIAPFSPHSPAKLLDALPEHGDAPHTVDFAAEQEDGRLIGQIHVDGEAGRDAIVSLLDGSDQLTVVKCTRPWPKGQEESVADACRLLTEITQNRAEELSPAELGHAYAYLGYVEDRAGNREAAIRWFEKVIPIEGPRTKGIRATAEAGLVRPIMMLRHLERLAAFHRRTPKRMRVLERIGAAVVSQDMPSDRALKTELTESERLENLELLWQAIDHWFSFFDHKNIDWPEVRQRYRPKARAAQTSDDYYQMLYQLVRELKDPHSWLCNSANRNELPRFSPAVAVRRIEGKAVVTEIAEKSEAVEHGLCPGSIITHVDSLTVAEKLEQLRPRLRVSSSERHFLEANFRRLLHGEEGTSVAISFIPPGSDTPQHLELIRDTRGPRDIRQPDFPVTKEDYVWSGIHPSGCGYIRITSFSGRLEIADQFDRALEKLKDTPALMIDIRENPGGYGTAHSRIVGRFLSEQANAGASCVKTGPAHTDFVRYDRLLAPTGPWQYSKPVALLTNPITGSASDIFARDLIGTGRLITVGTTTHGNSTGTCVFVTLPCNLVVRISRGYTCGLNDRIIEGNGSAPEIHAELTLDDILHGTDSVITRAAQALATLPSPSGPPPFPPQRSVREGNEAPVNTMDLIPSKSPPPRSSISPRPPRSGRHNKA